MSNTESIRDKLRRWADESESDNRRHLYPTFNACDDFGIKIPDDDIVSERELFRRIADEIDAEKREITEGYARQSWMNPADAIAKLATGEIEWPELKEAIDRYYLPRPLFEDGELVSIGDEVEIFRIKRKVTAYQVSCNDSIYMSVGDGGTHVFESEYRFKRHKPQVLDADGVPIEVGDTVWTINVPKGHDKRTVKGFKTFEEMGITDVQSTHAVLFEETGWMGNLRVTHREPDTQERIDRDALKSYNEYWGCDGVCSRCPARIDDEKLHERYDTSPSCTSAMTIDLLRRQRKLDGRDA